MPPLGQHARDPDEVADLRREIVDEIILDVDDRQAFGGEECREAEGLVVDDGVPTIGVAVHALDEGRGLHRVGADEALVDAPAHLPAVALHAHRVDEIFLKSEVCEGHLPVDLALIPIQIVGVAVVIFADPRLAQREGCVEEVIHKPDVHPLHVVEASAIGAGAVEEPLVGGDKALRDVAFGQRVFGAEFVAEGKIVRRDRDVVLGHAIDAIPAKTVRGFWEAPIRFAGRRAVLVDPGIASHALVHDDVEQDVETVGVADGDGALELFAGAGACRRALAANVIVVEGVVAIVAGAGRAFPDHRVGKEELGHADTGELAGERCDVVVPP